MSRFTEGIYEIKDVSHGGKGKYGRIIKFYFPDAMEQFLSKVIDVDVELQYIDPMVREILATKKMFGFYSGYMLFPVRSSLSNLVRSETGATTSSTWDKLIRIFRSYGYIGFKYNGGIFTGSSRHNAYSVWDEDFINSHKVGILR